MVAELFQGSDGRQDSGRDFLGLALQELLGGIGSQEVAVELLLELCHLAADNLDDLDSKTLGVGFRGSQSPAVEEQGQGCPSDNEIHMMPLEFT